jgi:glutamine synthetase
VLCAALGEHIVEHFLAAKRQVWREFSLQVHDWELERYLATY